MKKTLMGLFLLLLAISGYSQGLNKVIVEKYYVSDANDFTASGGTLPVGSVTWRIYVDMAPGYLFQQASGDKNHSLVFSTTTSFYNSDLGDNNPNGIATVNLKSGTVQLDSWLSTGAAGKNFWGVMKSQDDGVNTLVNTDGALQNADPTAGIPLKVQDGLLLAGSNGIPSVPSFGTLGIPDSVLAVLGDGTVSKANFTLTNGAWYILGGVSGPSTSNRVLIAQLTTDGTFHYELNFQLGKSLGGNQSLTEKYASKNIQSDELFDSKYNLSATLQPNVDLFTANITSPAPGSVFTAGDVVTINADASYSLGSISKVEFFVNNSKVGESVSAPYSYGWTSIAGVSSLTVVATNDVGEKKTSEAVSIDVQGVQAPTVMITTPASGSSFQLGDSLSIETSTTADAGNYIASVQFFVDNASIGTKNSYPFAIKYLGALGDHKIVAVATDSRNVTAKSDTVTISILSHIPTVNITSPVNGTSYLVGDMVAITADASDSQGSIDSVAFFVGDVKIGVSNSAPYSSQITADHPGSVVITAKAYNNANEYAISQVTIWVKLHAPTIDITAPVDGSSPVVGDSITISADASDVDAAITGVEFFVDGVSIGISNSAPYSIRYLTVSGSHVITAVASVNDTLNTTSTGVTIDVITGISNLKDSGVAFKIYPNPATEVISIEIPGSSQNRNISYKIINMQGAVIIDNLLNSDNQKVDISSLAKGIYSVIVTIDGTNSTRRFIKL